MEILENRTRIAATLCATSHSLPEGFVQSLPLRNSRAMWLSLRMGLTREWTLGGPGILLCAENHRQSPESPRSPGGLNPGSDGGETASPRAATKTPVQPCWKSVALLQTRQPHGDYWLAYASQSRVPYARAERRCPDRQSGPFRRCSSQTPLPSEPAPENEDCCSGL